MDGLCLKYFVLNPRKNNIYGEASRAALKIYASEIEEENPSLADDLYNWVDTIEEDLFVNISINTTLED